jgi:D-arabinose 1-dehydrogenase-like Zn-dependent alcohol dehydrogenase
MIAPASAMALIPEGLSAVDAGPLMCAGVTTFNPLRNSGARPGDLVAILGIGGLGHLGIQFAAKMGFRTVAIARGKDKEPLARKLGAAHYIDSHAQDPAAELLVLGGLSVNGKLIVVGAADEPLEVNGGLMLMGRRSIMGWPSGSSIDSQDTLSFSRLTGVRSMNEFFPLERAAEAYEHMMSGKARFRAVLTMRR